MADYMDDEVGEQESYIIRIRESSDEESEEFQIQLEMTHQEAVPDSNEEGEIAQISEQASGETLSEFGFAAQEALDIDGGWSIIRVPDLVRAVEKGAYSPRIVSIGPFHHNKEALRPYEYHKTRILSRLQNQRSRGCVEHLENAMKEMEEKTRKWYLEDFGGIKSDDFVRMMLLDGCFIVELLRLDSMKTSKVPEHVTHAISSYFNLISRSISFLYKSGRHLYTVIEFLEQGNDRYIVKDPIFYARWLVPDIRRDLLMLENQLPMFVLQKIYEITTTFDNKATDPLNKLALQFFEPLRLGKDKLEDHVLNTNQKYPHLLALFHTFMAPNDYPPSLPEGNSNNMSIYDKFPGKGWVDNATTLANVGVQFKNKSGNFLDIEYKNGLLKIPTLFIDDGTSTLLRNLIAYEQNNSPAAPYFSCLAVFLDSIVDTVGDINILRNAGIIKQPKGGNDDEVVKLFNSLTKGVQININNCYIKKQIEDINSRRGSYKHMFRFRRFLSTINFKSILSTYLLYLLPFILTVSHIKGFPNGSLHQEGCIN